LLSFPRRRASLVAVCDAATSSDAGRDHVADTGIGIDPPRVRRNGTRRPLGSTALECHPVAGLVGKGEPCSRGGATLIAAPRPTKLAYV